jgi:hypothetical protein
MLADEIGRRQKNNFSQSRDGLRLKLVARLYEMCELLGSHPRAERGQIREVLQDIRRLHQASLIDHGLLALVLHNMLRDLSGTAGQFEATYYAHQLAATAEQIRAK